MTSTSSPWFTNHFTCGYTGAVPTPPATNTTRSLSRACLSISINSLMRPRGPTTSANASPTSMRAMVFVLGPMAIKTIVMVPFSLSSSHTVKGMRSPNSSIFTIKNCPGIAHAANNGAYTSISTISGANHTFFTISYIDYLFLLRKFFSLHVTHLRIHQASIGLDKEILMAQKNLHNSGVKVPSLLLFHKGNDAL